jgi:hypothetical protein
MRQKIIALDIESLKNVLNLPEDAELVFILPQIDHGFIELTFESEQYPEVKAGDTIPKEVVSLGGTL